MIVLNKLFFLLFFSLTVIPSGYDFSFQKIIEKPPDIQIWNEKKYCDCPVVTMLNSQNVDLSKSGYTFDEQNKTAACLQRTRLYEYEIAFYSDREVCVPHLKACNKKPLCVGVSKNILITVENDWTISFIKVPKDKFGKYYTRHSETARKIPFGPDTTKMIQDELASKHFTNKVLYCFPGDYGRFYLTYDDKGTKDLYLLTIEEKEQPEEILTPNNGKEPSGLTGNKKFFTIPKILFMSGLVIGLLSIIFKSKICAFISFLKNR